MKRGVKIGRRKIDLDTPAWASIWAMFHTLAQTGMRKAEVALPHGEKWDRTRISFHNIRWLVDGIIYDALTVAQLNHLTLVVVLFQ